MFCSYCGKEIPENGGFCPYCGKKAAPADDTENSIKKPNTPSIENKGSHSLSTGSIVDKAEGLFENAQQVIQDKLGATDNRPQTHPYQKLGGILAAYAYVSLLIGIGCILFVIFNIFNATNLFMVFSLIMFCVVAFWYIRLFLMIQRKDAGFLGFYEAFGIIIHAAYAAIMLVVGGPYYGAYVFAVILSTIIRSAPAYVASIIYFSKSVRVRTYFGTDEYIKKSIFMKNSTPPIPAVPDRV